MTIGSSLICPHCGAEMNHHSDKLAYFPSAGLNSEQSTANEVILESHACPSCGTSEASVSLMKDMA
jgi:ribosomal protein S27AE